MLEIPEFRPASSARDAHGALRRSLEIAERAQHCAVLWFAEIQRRRLYRELGFSSMQLYATEKLGFSRAKTGDFVRLAAKLDQLPRLRDSLASGQVGYTKAREVIKVATPRTEARWVAEAQKSPRKVLAAKVARVRRKAAMRRRAQPELLPATRQEVELAQEIPQRVTLEMTPEQFARWEALWEKLHKLGGVPAGRVDELLEALAAQVEARGTNIGVSACKEMDNYIPAPRGAGPAAVLHVQECPSCRRATVQTGRGEQVLGPATRDRLECDAVVAEPATEPAAEPAAEPGSRTRHTIAPKTRREVLERDRFRCQTPGCTHSRFLEIHHKRPVSRGGGNTPDNLVTLCSACHGLIHARERQEQSRRRE